LLRKKKENKLKSLKDESLSKSLGSFSLPGVATSSSFEIKNKKQTKMDTTVPEKTDSDKKKRKRIERKGEKRNHKTKKGGRKKREKS